MADRYYVCASATQRAGIMSALRARHPEAVLLPVDDAWVLRKTLLAEMPGTSSAVIGSQCGGIEPINLASALVADGHAREVNLVAHHATGSLRSRARRSGIDNVLEEDEIVSTARVERRRQAEGSVAEAPTRVVDSGDPLDLDEVEGMTPPPPARAARPAPLPSHSSPILCFASGRGGVGKTAALATAAHILADWGLRVCVVDLDLSFGNAFSFFGLDGPADLSVLGDGRPCTAEACARCGRKVRDGLSLWGPCSRPELAETVAPITGELLAHVSDTCDVVLVDTSPDWGDETAAAAQMCDRLILVADERAGAVGSLARAGSLAVRLGVARTRIVRLMNRCDRRRRDEGFLARADMGLETAKSFRILDGGEEVAEILSSGHADELAHLEGDFTQSVAAFIAQMMSELGKLPSHADAAKALQGGKRKSWSFLSFRREAS